MTTNDPSRLDRIERILEGVSQQQQATQQQLDRTQQQLDRTQQIVDSNARAISANSAAIAQGRQETTEIREDLRNVTQMILDLGSIFDAQFERIERQLEQDRAERVALSTDVRSLIDTLRERFSGNGHS